MRQLIAILLMLCTVLPAPAVQRVALSACAPDQAVADCAEACPCCAAGQCACEVSPALPEPEPVVPVLVLDGRILPGLLPQAVELPARQTALDRRMRSAQQVAAVQVECAPEVPLYVRHQAFLR